MALGIGIIGIGCMGRVHFDTLRNLKNANVVALCDVDKKKLAGNWTSTTGNIGGTGSRQDLGKIRTYAHADQVLEDPAVDVVDVTLPTHLHAETSTRALRAGKHVICEKPMALTSADCRKMIDAAGKARRKLFVAQCIRFWPEYVKTRQIIKNRTYGRVVSAIFTRLSATPSWSFDNWLLNPKASGAAALDLHIHDADYILHTFGKPRSVTSRASGLRPNCPDHIVTTYDYGGNCLVSAEGSWVYTGEYPFSMSFRIALERATLTFGADGLMLYPRRGKARKVKVAAGDGYIHELKHFLDCIAKGRSSDVVPPKSAMQTIRLIEAEVKSARGAKTVKITF